MRWPSRRPTACDMETAALRVFGNAEGAYGANVSHLVDCSRWDDGDELAETFTRRKGFAYGRGGRPVQQPALLHSVLAGVNLAYQSLDSVELGVTTIDTYFDTLGGISRAVTRAKRSEQTRAVRRWPRHRSISATRRAARARCARCRSRWRWKRAPACSTPSGTRACWNTATRACARSRRHVTNTMGWSATTGQVQPWVYQQMTRDLRARPRHARAAGAAEPHGLSAGGQPPARSSASATTGRRMPRRSLPCSAPATNWKTASKAFTRRAAA